MNRLFVFGALALLVISCTANSDDKKDFSSIKQGMKKDEVVKLVGKPEKETNLVMVEMWKYPNHGKIVVLNSDTVVQVLADSVNANSAKQ
ncbi:hypothetical protein [Solitalea lacus]|uniref:hypothetical protein n=1 Tax=Solitalea lacus TaxID=2911172 RepID=UPI001EDB4911|nr:hypothetical protein [Solitalea lacus]UKJ07468.1 hypothetical protein L2B55_18350 [Solitalea lacus]